MIELKLIKDFPCEIIAVDEVGRGPLCGPVVIGAVRIFIQEELQLKNLIKYLRPKGVRDSKMLSEIEREELLKKLKIHVDEFRKVNEVTIKDVQISYVTWEMSHEVIDEINILAASLRGMREAGMRLSQTSTPHCLIDGNQKLRLEDHSGWIEHTIIKGDSKSVLIGLASILAKQKRDSYMKLMHEIYPAYGMDRHFGYPTKEHKKVIASIGPSPIHRKSFKGVIEFV